MKNDPRRHEKIQGGDSEARSHRGFFATAREVLRRYFVTGVLIFAPIGVTVWAIVWIIQKLDNVLLPHLLSLVFPTLESTPRLPFVGAIFTLFVILLLGVIARHFFGAEMVRAGERILGRVPVARSIYGGVKQLTEAIFASQTKTTFRRVVLVEYPRREMWVVAFTTGSARGTVADALDEAMVNCFVPTTPNPTSGFFLMLPERDVRPVDISVEDAFKLVMSGGLVHPGDRGADRSPPLPVAAHGIAGGASSGSSSSRA